MITDKAMMTKVKKMTTKMLIRYFILSIFKLGCDDPRPAVHVVLD